MVANPEPTTMPVEEYLALEETSQEKHEYVHGYVYAMFGGTSAHDAIANNARFEIMSHMRDGRCELRGPDMRVRINANVYYYPDALVICDEIIGDTAIEVGTPCLIVEVLSGSTEANDRGGKFAHYQTLATFEEYVLIDAHQRSVERFRRTAPNLWTYQRYGPGDDITLETIGLTCPIARFYNGTQL